MPKKIAKVRKSTARFPLRVRRSETGLGLFTATPIRKGRRVIEYGGKLISATEGDTLDDNNRYIFSVSKRYDLDGSPRWNTARYINHSCRPNCEAINIAGRVHIIARRHIEEGEELTYHYGRDHFKGYIEPIGCRCEKCSAKARA